VIEDTTTMQGHAFYHDLKHRLNAFLRQRTIIRPLAKSARALVSQYRKGISRLCTPNGGHAIPEVVLNPLTRDHLADSTLSFLNLDGRLCLGSFDGPSHQAHRHQKRCYQNACETGLD
jgi:hypothetical protein